MVNRFRHDDQQCSNFCLQNCYGHEERRIFFRMPRSKFKLRLPLLSTLCIQVHNRPSLNNVIVPIGCRIFYAAWLVYNFASCVVCCRRYSSKELKRWELDRWFVWQWCRYCCLCIRLMHIPPVLQLTNKKLCVQTWHLSTVVVHKLLTLLMPSHQQRATHPDKLSMVKLKITKYEYAKYQEHAV